MAGRLLGLNYLRSGQATITSSSNIISGYPAANMVEGRTSTQTGFTANTTGEVVFDFGSTRNVTAFGIAKHNLASVGATLNIAVSTNNSSYTTAYNAAVSSDAVDYQEFSQSHACRYVRVRVSGHTAAAYIGNLTVGEFVSTGSGQKIGFVAPFWAFRDEIVSSVTRGNDLSGYTVIKKPREFKLNIDFVALDNEGVYAYLLNAINVGPFYYKWAVASEDGINAANVYAWPKSGYPNLRFDTHYTRAVSLDCLGIV